MIVIGIDTPMAKCDTDTDVGNSLEQGYVEHGPACGRSGVAWYDASQGVSYGDGRRFESEETRGMTKIPSKHDKRRDENGNFR